MTSRHPYGPHRPEDAPNAVTVLGAGRWPAPEVRPMHPAIVRQRAQLNTIAHEAAASEQPGDAELVPDLEPWWPCTCGLWHRASEACADGVVVSDG